MKKPKVVTIVGRSDSGKTTLVEKLIAAYRARGLVVSAVKSMQHDFSIDQPGKDSSRYKEAGADSLIITNGKTYALVSGNRDHADPLKLALRHFSGSDIIIIEGYKEGRTPKVEVVGDSNEPPLYRSGIENIRMIVSDRKQMSGMPVFRRNDVEGIMNGIERHIFD